MKIFLTASPEARANRRFLELKEKNQNVPYETVLADIIERDKRDSERAVAPLKAADDAILVDTSEINFDQSLKLILDLIMEHK